MTSPPRSPFVLPSKNTRDSTTARSRRSRLSRRDALLERLSPKEVVERIASGTLPPSWKMRFAPAGLMSLGEELVLDQAVTWPTQENVGHAICLLSGGRLAFRRLLGVYGHVLRLRCDVAPFEDTWQDEILGYVRPRAIDKIAAASPVLWTRANWNAAMSFAWATSRRQNLPKHTVKVPFRTELLSPSDWPRIREFWLAACGTPLPSEPHTHQHVIGLLVGDVLTGVNIHLFTGRTSYSAFTLVHPDYRGIGGGRAMIQHSVRLARERGNELIYVHIDARNFASMAAYEHVGFKPAGWWSDEADPMAAAERQWRVFELAL